MNKPLILIIEDDAAVRKLLAVAMETQGYRFRTASTGKQGVLETASYNPDAALVNLGLPDIDGLEVIKKIRRWSVVPIIVLSERNEEKDKICALDIGADDYVTKPFSVGELLARIRAVLRRAEAVGILKENASPIFLNGALKIDYAGGCAYLKEQEIHLTPIEYKLLCLLSKNVGKVLTHTYITHEIWGSAWENDVASLRVFMASLRKKIEIDAARPKYIQTHVGVGYKMLKLE